jgi:AcrR family transcriptional regulator
MLRSAKADPRVRILDAAENAIAEAGFAGASLRDIVAEARVNLATVYYYFGSKTGLMEAVLKRRFGPLREEHLALLHGFEAQAKGRPLRVQKILEAMLLPPLRLAARAPAKHQVVTRLIGRLVTEPDEQIQKVLRSQRAEVLNAFVQALQRSLPGAPLPALRWRIEFVWGALAFALCNSSKIEVETRGACDLTRTDEVLAQMLDFFTHGFRTLTRGGLGRSAAVSGRSKIRKQQEIQGG